MIYPSAVDCLKNIEFTLEDKIRPALAGTLERSTLATIGHLLRHVACRIEREGEVLSDDIRRLRSLLAEIRAYAVQQDDDAVPAAIDSVLERRFRAADAYPSLTLLAEEAGALREALATAQHWLVAAPADRKDTAAYREIRRRIRDYVGHQLSAEAELVEPAFLGHGPRR